MRISDAIKRPFQDGGILIIGIILTAIPILNAITIPTVILGYMLLCGKTITKRKWRMPRWDDWGDLFVTGLIGFIIASIYMIPAMLIAIFTLGLTLITIGLAGLLGSLAALLGALTIGGMLTFIVLLTTFYFIPAALLRYIGKRSLSAAFDFNFLKKKVFDTRYLGAWVFSVIYYIVLVMILSFIPYIGIFIAMFIAGVTGITLIAEAYQKIRA